MEQHIQFRYGVADQVQIWCSRPVQIWGKSSLDKVKQTKFRYGADLVQIWCSRPVQIWANLVQIWCSRPSLDMVQQTSLDMGQIQFRYVAAGQVQIWCSRPVQIWCSRPSLDMVQQTQIRYSIADPFQIWSSRPSLDMSRFSLYMDYSRPSLDLVVDTS